MVCWMSALTVGGRFRSACSCWISAYSWAVTGSPSMGDRPSVIISVRNTSSGRSSGGGSAIERGVVRSKTTAVMGKAGRLSMVTFRGQLRGTQWPFFSM